MENDYYQPEFEEKKKSKTFLGAIGTGLIFIATKFKFLLTLLKMSKFLSTGISMFIMVGVYAKIYGWIFGVGFVLLLFAHEMGHVIAARREKLNVSAPIFIPFVGAFINMKEQPHDAVMEAKVGLGGPLLGTIASLLCVGLYFLFKEDFFLALAYVGFFLNIFNLIPMSPLDGGRIVTAVSTKVWFIGIPVMGVVAFLYTNPIMILIIILGIFEIYNNWKHPKSDYYNVSFKIRLAFAVAYVLLFIVLGIGMAEILSLHSDPSKLL